MSAFDALQKYYSSPGNMGAPRATMREESSENPAHVVDGELVHGGRPVENSVEKDDLGEAKQTASDQPDVRQILEGIRAKNADAESSNRRIKKALPHDRGWRSPKSDSPTATEAWGIFYRIHPELRGDFRDTPNYKTGDSPKSMDTKYYRQYARIYDAVKAGKRQAEKGRRTTRQASEKAIINMEKASVSPYLARLLSAAAGWALSGDIAGKVDPHLAQEWDRASSHREKKELQEEMMRQMHRRHKKPQAKLLVIHRKSDDGNFLDDSPAFGDLHMFYKDHAPIPPRQGLQWDAVKHRWTRPEKIGRTVWEVQGHKRFRGTGTGAHERGRKSGGSGGYGAGSSEAGRRLRSVGDVGRVHPHEAKHPGQQALHRFGKTKQLARMGMKRR